MMMMILCTTADEYDDDGGDDHCHRGALLPCFLKHRLTDHFCHSVLWFDGLWDITPLWKYLPPYTF